MSRPGRPVSLQSLLDGRSRLSSLQRESKARGALLARVRAALPAPLAAEVYAASLRGGELTLTVASGARATHLRLAGPRLAARLVAEHAMACDRVNVKVRPRAAEP